MCGRRIEVLFSVVEGEGEEEGEENEGGPDGEGDDDCVDEAGCGDWGGEGGVWSLFPIIISISLLVLVSLESGLTKPSGRLLHSMLSFIVIKPDADVAQRSEDSPGRCRRLRNRYSFDRPSVCSLRNVSADPLSALFVLSPRLRRVSRSVVHTQHLTVSLHHKEYCTICLGRHHKHQTRAAAQSAPFKQHLARGDCD